nr:5-hydroxytryptamine receptor 3B [Nothobranchius furzeri]
MTLTSICFLLLIVGNISCLESEELQNDQHKSNESFAEFLDINNMRYELSDAGNQTSNHSSDTKAHTCSYLDVLNYLNFTKNKEMYTLTRPVKDHKQKTNLYLVMVVYAILDVRVADQTFIVYVWIEMVWKNEFISWEEEDFCGISKVIVPTDTLWQPDITIEEMVEKDKAPPSPFLQISHEGYTFYRNDKVVISTCKMQVYKFPFDIQSCNITFKSVLYTDEELQFHITEDNALLTAWSKEVMDSQYEWEFLNQSAHKKTVHYFGDDQTVIIYTIKMRRKSMLYVSNFLLPILFFLCLDFASLMMSNSGGEKIGFKITVLLAVTVMQLLLNEILPFTSRRIPLIVVYCIGTFALMLLSLLEAILMKYLAEKDSTSQDRKNKNGSGLKEEREIEKGGPIHDEMGDQISSIYKEDSSSSQLTEIFLAVEKVSDELGKMKKFFLLSSKKEEVEPGYWTNVTNKFNTIFSIFYITSVIVFLCTLFSVWTSDSD